MAVELRNKLQATTGLALATTVVFDYSSCAELSEFILSEIVGVTELGSGGVEVELDGLELALGALVDEQERARAVTRLQALAGRFADNGEAGHTVAVADQIHAATDEEIFGFIDNELESL
jgi:polyketide synthase 12